MSRIGLVTGATAGFGEAISHKLAELKYNLIIAGRREDRLLKLKQELELKYKVKVYTACFDVRDYNAVEGALSSNLPKGWSNIDLLVNNAGLAVGYNSIHEGAIDDWNRMIDTNIKGLLYVTRVVSPRMVERKSGHIINIGSIAGKDSYLYGNVYCATKHAVDALSKGMRQDLLAYNIKVTQICPGAAETEFSMVRFKGDKNRSGKVYQGYDALTASDIANAVEYIVSQPAHVTVQDILIMPTAQATGSMIYRK